LQMMATANEAHENKAAEMSLGFRVLSAGIIHRYPVITPEEPAWAKEFHALQEDLAARRMQILHQEVSGTGSDLLPENMVSEDDILASMPFAPASRTTSADEENDVKSLERKLDSSLFLLVKRRRNDKSWQFPQGKVRDDEDLRGAAERVTDRAVGRISRWFVSNAPQGHYIYAYPKDLQEKRGQYGAKVFFYRCQHIVGNIKLETKLYTDYAWVSRDEVDEYFDEETAYYMRHLLLD